MSLTARLSLKDCKRRIGKAALTGKNYCGNLLWQSSLTLLVLEGLKFSVVVDNLFDEEYCDYATYGTQYYPAAGCSFTFTVRYEF